MSWQAELQAMGKMAANVPLAPRTTLGVGGEAAWLFRPSDKVHLIAAMSLIPEDVMLLPLGRGSNVLIADSGIDGLVLDLGDINTLHITDETIKVGAGVRMSKLAQAAANHGLTGLEFMATVPGDLGGGVAMNAGAFGQQISDVLVSVDVLHRDGHMACVSRDALDMRYRYTKLPQGALVVSATLQLETSDTEQIKAAMRDMRSKRSGSQPLALPNCGSVFKNPEGNFAARLIEGVGLKGEQRGKARISDVHANFIVNEGGASSEDVLHLIRLAKAEVKKQTNIDLEPEVKLVGCSL
ncbi:UDP-N-acetylmuramate dehydrogenase [Ghiorsea bivora]|uniref:UDP-N-acetylmuramate dehydrogenase n=1 Tax=Ghiorsea bivora TaxID=1485545 RepID=UPI00056FE683|nr:UDP-N-acetylmuramate dehydrogenase [Ghiorsea bivora]